MTWVKYTNLEPVKRLKNEGRELIGKTVLFTEKRDGENVSIWLDENRLPHISSHNMEEADKTITDRMTQVPEYIKALNLLANEEAFHKKWILYGELLKLVSPTRIEPRRKYTHWILFDMRDVETGKFADYSYIFQCGYHFKIPVVNMIGEFRVENLEHLQTEINGALKWCKRHRREGVVGKSYRDDIFFKEKIDLPIRPKIPRLEGKPQLPEMDQHTIFRALQHAYDDVLKNEFDWKDKSKTMPIVAKHFQLEASEHNFSTPRNIYQLYIDTTVDSLKEATPIV